MHFDVLFPTDEVIGGLPADLLTRPDEERREVEVRQVRADGESFPACLTLSERRNHDGVRDGHVLTVLDETATQEAEAVRRSSCWNSRRAVRRSWRSGACSK